MVHSNRLYDRSCSGKDEGDSGGVRNAHAKLKKADAALVARIIT